MLLCPGLSEHPDLHVEAPLHRTRFTLVKSSGINEVLESGATNQELLQTVEMTQRRSAALDFNQVGIRISQSQI